MKKLLSLALALLMLMSALPALASVQDIAKEAEQLTHEQLVEKAKAEEGVFIAYGNTSRITTALESFCALYDIKAEGNNLKDGEIYTKLEAEAKSKSKGADMVMIQDSATLKDHIAHGGFLVNFLPSSVKDQVSEEDQNPLVHQFTNKVFIWNNKGDKVPAITNVWQLTEEQFKGNILFKNPENELVNMNFLVMLTSPEWSDKLAAAYKALYGKDIDLGDYPNAGYKWIAEFLSNCSFGSSDTKIAEEVSQDEAAGKLGLFVLSKLRSSSVHTDNLTVGQYVASETGTPLEPFAGFMYPIYAMVTANANRPYTAMLFIEYLMSQEGFAPWGKSIGAYSGNSAIPSKEGDLSLDVWKKTLVTEDPDYILDHSAEVYDFVIKYIQ